MGILNVTPDSFSDGGRFMSREDAVEQALRMVGEGADIIDVGGESTRPGASAVSLEEELERVVPVIEGIVRQSDVPVSVDTTRAAVARAALKAGARVINDVSALTLDEDMVAVARDSRAGLVLTHMRGSPRTMQTDPHYEDVVAEVSAYLDSRVRGLTADGIDKQRLSVDPGIGFGKTVDHNLRLLAGLEDIGACGVPVVVGLSRKSFLGKLTGRATGDRLAGSLAALVFCILNGAHIMRVHDVAESLDAIRVVEALARVGKGESARVE
jgi:dihydropteroate synthase